MLDVTGLSTANGALLQQWDWVNGLNQQWEITPAQTSTYVSGQTNVWYNSSNGLVYVSASSDADYQTQYYYPGDQLATNLFENGVFVAHFKWGEGDVDHTGWGHVYGAYGAKPGAYYEATTSESLAIAYKYSQITAGCGAYCNAYYDAFSYSSVLENPQTTDVPVFTTVVWGAPIALGLAHIAAQLIHLGSHSDGVRVPGANNTVFGLKYKGFIPAAWVSGVGYPADFCTDSHGTIRTPIYAGDHRGFDPFGSYRADLEGYISTGTGAAVGLTFVDAGTTTR